MTDIGKMAALAALLGAGIGSAQFDYRLGARPLFDINTPDPFEIFPTPHVSPRSGSADPKKRAARKAQRLARRKNRK